MRKKAPTDKPLKWEDPGNIINHPTWMEYFQRFSDYYEQVLRWTDPYHPQFGQVEPTNPPDGLIAYADAVNWAPGGPPSYYRYNASTSTWMLIV